MLALERSSSPPQRMNAPPRPVQKVELDDVSAVPVLPVIEKLPGWRNMLRTMTPPGDEVPFGWEVLSTAEFVHMLVEPAVAAQLEAARRGQCPTDTITRTVVPLLEVPPLLPSLRLHEVTVTVTTT